jgi:hypothetical protein
MPVGVTVGETVLVLVVVGENVAVAVADGIINVRAM